MDTREKVGVESEVLEERVRALEEELERIRGQLPEDRLTMVVFSGDMDRVFASFIIATGAIAMGYEVSMFFTFWGLSALKKGRNIKDRDDVFEKAMEIMTPGSIKTLGTSKMNFFGLGPAMFRKMMRDKDVVSLEELFDMAREYGVKMIACEMSRDVMGIKDTDLVDGLEHGGVAMYLDDALRSRATLFI